jgi:hypothetical protein
MEYLDKGYAEFLLSKIWKVLIDFRIYPTSILGTMHFAFGDREMAHTAAYYFLYRLRNKKILISLNISKEHELSIVLDCKDFNEKIVCKTKQYPHFELANHMSSGKVPYGTHIGIGFHFPESLVKPDTLPLTIIDSTISEMPIAYFSGELYTFGNDGLELLPPELPTF